MKIAIVAPSPVPFTIGGAENLSWGLLQAINQTTAHQAELIKVPSPEHDLWSVIESYRRFSELDLSHFDKVISTKYPSWMVGHHDHVCYLLHRLRGLYDTYGLMGLPGRCESEIPSVRTLLHFMKAGRGCRKSLPEFFSRLELLRNDSSVPRDLYAFPGPFAREVVHFLDGIGLALKRISLYAAISRNVASREAYFPEGARVEIVYPPSHLPRFRTGRSEYLFTASRLDGPKRVQLLVEAMKHVKSPVELRIAGSGPEEEKLREMADGDPRIIFLGFVNDSELIDLYADALAVLFVPYDEDYGLITIEAMMSGKPVITTTDSGGPNEFVRDRENGFSVAPNPQALAERIDHLAGNREIARSMGLRGRDLVKNITWENAVRRLLGSRQASSAKRRRMKMTVTSTFPIYPPRGGGQSRVFNLYRHLAGDFDIEIVTLTNAGEKPLDEVIAPNLREIRVPKSAEHQEREWECERKTGVLVTDVVMPELYHLTQGYLERLRDSTREADFVVACHPYLFPAIREVSDKRVFYEAQDVEYELKRTFLPDTGPGRELLGKVCAVEAECCSLSDLIMVCSEEDGEILVSLYGTSPTKICTVPNGVDLSSVNYVSPEERRLIKKRLGMNGSFTALFMGSWHGPNLDAVRTIFGIARHMPDVNFLIIGSASLAFQEEKHPTNVGFLGVVDDETKNTVLGVADLALNPMESGSGTNLKMFDYLAAGLPVISTPHGARGLSLKRDEDIEIVPVQRFPEAIRALQQGGNAFEKRIARARARIEERYDWAVIAHEFLKVVREKFG